MVAYLDEGAWEIADQIVDKMERGKMHGKAIPTTFTFRFLSGCKTSGEKKERLLEYMRHNELEASRKHKKRAFHPESKVLLIYLP